MNSFAKYTLLYYIDTIFTSRVIPLDAFYIWTAEQGSPTTATQFRYCTLILPIKFRLCAFDGLMSATDIGLTYVTKAAFESTFKLRLGSVNGWTGFYNRGATLRVENLGF